MSQLFRRAVAVTVGTTRITGLRIEFRIKKTSTPEPNTLDLAVTNLSSDTRAKLREGNQRVVVEAGYTDSIEELFVGTSRTITHSRSGADIRTRIQCGDGEAQLRTARINESFAPGTKPEEVVRKLAASLGLDPGNAFDKLREGGFRGAISEFTSGLTLSGKSGDELARLAKSLGFGFSVQDGRIQLLREGETSRETAVVLSPETGLIGSPEPGDGGVVKALSLLQPGLRPGRAVELRSEAVQGMYRVQTVTHSGDTHGVAWHSELELQPVTR